MTLTVETVMELAPVIPVLVIDRVEDAVPIAQALVRGGLPALEVTMRTAAALEVMREMAQVEGAVVGAGTVLNPRDLDAALSAGAQFIVSPGLTEPLGRAAIDTGVPFLPGTATAGDIMRGLDMGLTHFKFFPAETSGGLPALKALAAPLYRARFCPTGGITADNAAQWLAQPFVKCVGGSWIVPKGPVDPERIETLARVAAGLST
ncbi:bifunctional 4-hydroxy-2-oxoglutarate aldolase/2-dehydro-3-deoxy-phosphogluconate aldolase [Sphingobium sp. AN641]|uniref:bifunctional 4-hydroxy-2-oxoglutarate aldolase/2-dehydro-3-deoxy-phosphogluconate aldolase n=1 Tax=Sphingobium sp. AN641 TaxID=3133443 RepID=UPI0030BC99AE